MIGSHTLKRHRIAAATFSRDYAEVLDSKTIVVEQSLAAKLGLYDGELSPRADGALILCRVIVGDYIEAVNNYVP